MIIPDVNALVYGFRPNTTFHQLARDVLFTFRDRGELLVLVEVAASFLRIVTDRRLSADPDEPAAGREFIEALSFGGRFLREPNRTRWERLMQLSEQMTIAGPLVPDALLAATCQDLNASIITADHDFLRFPGTRVKLLTPAGLIDHVVVS